MTNLNVENVGREQFNNDVGSNVIKVDLVDITINCPMVAPHQSEITKAKRAEIKLKSKLIQYVHRVERKKRITTNKIKNGIIDDLKIVLDANPECLVDIYFQYWKKYFPTEIERQNILEIQVRSGCLIISDYETNPNQSSEQFEKQIQQLLKDYPDKIVSPTLDLGTESVKKFEDKIDLLFKYGIKRFNVIFRNMFDAQDNWIALSKKIYGKDIWCNVVGVPQQYNSSIDPFSLITSVFIYGVHTTSLQYPRFSKKTPNSAIKEKPKSKIIYIFNPKTGYFEITSTMTDEEARAYSINALVEYTDIIRQKILSGKFYSEFIQTQPFLYGILHSRI